VTAEQAAVIARVAEPRHLTAAAEQGVDLAVVDRLLTGVACEASCAEVAKAVAHYLDRLDEDGPEPDPTEGRRRVENPLVEQRVVSIVCVGAEGRDGPIAGVPGDQNDGDVRVRGRRPGLLTAPVARPEPGLLRRDEPLYVGVVPGRGRPLHEEERLTVLTRSTWNP
jgi:hypothetical protein